MRTTVPDELVGTSPFCAVTAHGLRLAVNHAQHVCELSHVL